MCNYISTGDSVCSAGQTIEAGEDNDSRIGSNLQIINNYFYGGVNRVPISNTQYSGNYHYLGFGTLGIYASSGVFSAAARLNISGNHYACPGARIISGGDNEPSCGINVTGIPANGTTRGFPFVTVSNNEVHDGHIFLMAPNCILENNRIFNSLGGAITTRGAR